MSGNCTNIALVHVVDKLKLCTIPHPTLYSLQWLKKANEVHITRHVLITYNIGNLKDEVVCDVLPMDTCQVYLGRPWQFDKRAIHHGKSNTNYIKVKGCSYALASLPSSQVYNVIPNLGKKHM